MARTSAPWTSLILAAWASGCSGSPVRAEDPEDVRAALEGTLRYGPVEGFLQIPGGGQPGTTSRRRPAFDEVGIRHAASGGVAGRLGWRDHELAGSVQLLRLSGRGRLEEDLLSRDQTFPAGASVKLSTRLDTYALRYQHRFRFQTARGDAITFRPGAGLVLFGFHYELDGPGALGVEREFTKGAPQVGLGAEWDPPGPFSLTADVRSTLPFKTYALPLLLSAAATARYRLWGEADGGGASGRVFLGAGYDLIDLEDNQVIPNRIRASVGPMVLLGLEARF